jgi:hypothetical protein
MSTNPVFQIEIDRTAPVSDGKAYGVIRIGDFTESFIVSIGYWSPEKYESSWRKALEKLVGGAKAVALFTWMATPKSEDNRRAWLLP